ncbi:MAG: hypothetical protein P4K86_02510 [Terracidiphilus sp.]|nr:hypothetical protein [Terracidiphilus sp.]MDR3776358.1 hypothetical protein [Terracidiphilus sp.]
MSSRKTGVHNPFAGRAVLAAMGLLAALPLCAQYPGQVTKSTKDSPELRAIAVLEWTGEAGKPKTSRLVPVAVLDGGQLQDGGIYLARPQPLALAGEVEYELQQNGKPVGLFDIKNSGQEQGSWVGYGAWKAMPKARPKTTEKLKVEDEESDQPVLHRKHHPGDAPTSKDGGAGVGSDGPAPASDPDRPTLHKKPASDSTGEAGSDPAPDPDRPTLHKKAPSDSSGSEASAPAADDPDRPTLKKTRKKPAEDIGRVDSLPSVTDPDRPLLKRGKAGGNGLDVVPTLMGLPADMQQTVAVSDVKSRAEHQWSYAWANPDDAEKMKSVLEDMAREAMGLTPPPAAAPPVVKRAASKKKAKPAVAPPTEPEPLMDEQFRVFELAYGSGATLVLTAHSDAPLPQRKFVTLVVQPDLYGNAQVLLKSVTDGAHLDETPRMRLVDAVDALADNRGELLFELRGATQRQFALYRVLRGQAEKLFVGGGGEFGKEARRE